MSDIPVVTSLAQASAHAPFDLALFTVKTYDTDATIIEMQAADLGQPTLLSLQNGVYSEEALGRAFGRSRVIAGTILNPISVPAVGTVELEKWRGGLGLAPVAPDSPLDTWLSILGTVLPTRLYANYRSMKWSKLLLNVIGNASAAILDMNTVQVYADPRLVRLEVEMLRETANVMRGLNVKPVNLPGYPVPLLAWGVRWAPLFILRPVLRRLVAGGRGQKPPSLLLDLRRGRERSEVAFLNGAVVQAGRRTGIPAPVNHALTETLTRLSQRQIQWDNVRQQPGVLLAIAAEMKRKAKQGRLWN
jgi:2-dehydropantoate 2-reductase